MGQNSMWTRFIIVIFGLYGCNVAGEGLCRKNGLIGTCTKFESCNSAAEALMQGEKIQKCGFDVNSKVMVCCYDHPLEESDETTNQRTTPKSKNDDDYSDDYGSDESGVCPPILSNWTAPARGKKAWQKCLEYQDKLVYPCMKSLSLMPGSSRRDYCHHTAQGLIIGGTVTAPHEFPHMYCTELAYMRTYGSLFPTCPKKKEVDTANHCKISLKLQKKLVFERPNLKITMISNKYRKCVIIFHPGLHVSCVLLGYNRRSEPNNTDISRIQWLCGGSLISERYVLTAAHCLSDSNIRNVKYVFVGGYKRIDTLDASRIYRVRRRIKYPSYKPPSKYDDIALLELARNVSLDDYTVPACLHVGDKVDDSKVTATGWGLTEYLGTFSNKLHKVILNKFTTAECFAHFPPEPQMKFGFDEDTQLCYGDKQKSKDTCQGDSGGPIQIKSQKIKCMYVIVGVTSFGRACGFVGEPGIYTKIAHYVPWIEKIVWP